MQGAQKARNLSPRVVSRGHLAGHRSRIPGLIASARRAPTSRADAFPDAFGFRSAFRTDWKRTTLFAREAERGKKSRPPVTPYFGNTLSEFRVRLRVTHLPHPSNTSTQVFRRRRSGRETPPAEGQARVQERPAQPLASRVVRSKAAHRCRPRGPGSLRATRKLIRFSELTRIGLLTRARGAFTSVPASDRRRSSGVLQHHHST